MKKKVTPWLFVGPALIAYLLIVIIPIISSFYYSLFDWNGIGNMKFIGLGNFVKQLHDSTFHTIIKNNLVYAGINTVMQILLGILLAILLMHLTKGKNLVKTLYFTPCIVSSIAICQVFEKLLSKEPMGVINAVLGGLGLESMQRAFTADPKLSLYVVAFVEFYKWSALYMIIFYSAFISISEDIVEAAVIDGASGLQQYLYIRIPLIRNIIFVALVMVVSGTLKGFDVSYILTSGGPGYSSELVATYMYKQLFTQMNFGYGSSLAIFLVVECVVVVSLLKAITPRDAEC
ncbi:MAG: sugar ABC transporter permease [Lachnospiraceae bacterium]|nr:sugar ABC transporter permease [Lachnospiraceae bacterium]